MKRKRQDKDLTRLSQPELVALAVYVLGGALHAVDTEDVAVKAHELAPGRLSWRKYPDQINLELVRVFLSDAKKPQVGYVSGTGKTGWTVTEEGLAWARETSKRFPALDLSRSRQESREGSMGETRWRREQARITSSAAWDCWCRDEAPGLRDAEDVFRIDTYASGSMRQTKVTRLLELFSNDDEIAPFLEALLKVLQSKGKQQ